MYYRNHMPHSPFPHELKGHYYPLADTGHGPANFIAWRNYERFMISSGPTGPVFAEMLA